MRRLLLLLLAMASLARAAFVETLSPEDKASAGLTRLSPGEIAVLDSLVEGDAKLAREGGVNGFATAFTRRHTPKQSAEAGLSHLSPAEKASLDQLVAFAIAHPLPEIPHYVARPTAALAASPPAGPALPLIPTVTAGPEIHGDLSFTVGGGKGFSFYGGGIDLNITDPSGRFSGEIGIYELRGRGRPFPWYYGLAPWTCGLGPGPDPAFFPPPVPFIPNP